MGLNQKAPNPKPNPKAPVLRALVRSSVQEAYGRGVFRDSGNLDSESRLLYKGVEV